MARTSTIEVPPELQSLFNDSIEQRDRFILGVCQSHKRRRSKRIERQIAEKSLFGFLAIMWRTLTDEQKDAWRTAGQFSNLTNWQLFISDNAARLRHDLPLYVPPSELWQVRAGQILVEDPASEIILKQEHPHGYWVAQKVVGASWKRELVFLKEFFSLPLDLGIRYKANLTAEGGTQRARYFARVWTSYQGQDSETDFAIDFDPVTDWKHETLEISGLRGVIVAYTLFIEIIGYRGELLFDNIRAVHSGTNWALDPRCDEINKTFQKAFSIVPPFWVPVSIPDGASFASHYPPSLS